MRHLEVLQALHNKCPPRLRALYGRRQLCERCRGEDALRQSMTDEAAQQLRRQRRVHAAPKSSIVLYVPFL